MGFTFCISYQPNRQKHRAGRLSGRMDAIEQPRDGPIRTDDDWMSGDVISVVVPACNAERFIARTLRSVIRQTYQHIEVAVVDDGSCDGTADAVRQVGATDRRIKLFTIPHRGVSAARNFGIAMTSGAFIAPIDADDLWHPDKLARQMDLMRRAPNGTGVVYCWAAGIDENDRTVLPVWNRSYAEGDVLHDIIVTGILSNGSTPLIRREAIDSVGGYDEGLDLCEDWKFYTALAGACRFAVIPECLTGYRLRNDSASSHVGAMEAAIQQVTQWIRSNWPHISEQIFREREYTVNAYLAFLSIRVGDHRGAMRYLLRACKVKPVTLVDFSIAQYVVLMLGHMIGIRRYQWAFWRKPQPFLKSTC